MSPLFTLVALRISLLVSLISRKIAAANGLAYTDNLIVDSGSGNTLIGSGTKYKPTSTSVDTQQPLKIIYEDESNPFIGMTYKDIISCHIHTYVRNFVHRHSHSQ